MKSSKRPQIIMYEEGKRYKSVDDMKRRPIKSLFKDRKKIEKGKTNDKKIN